MTSRYRHAAAPFSLAFSPTMASLRCNPGETALPQVASGSDAQPRAQASSSPGSRLFWVLTAVTGLVAVSLAARAWILTLGPAAPMQWLDVGVRTAKVLLLSDIYYDNVYVRGAQHDLFEWARFLGVVFSLLAGGRLLLFTAGSHLAGFVVGFRSNHEVVLGNAQAATEYVPLITHRRVTHVMAGTDNTGGRVALLRREGSLKHQLKRAAASRAHRIVVAETSDAETWNTAQAAARLCPHVDVLAYIGDSWMQDRLSRASPEARLRTFSYAGGVARQVMLAYPPYLMARRYGAGAQHIVVVGFGPVGQALAREFLVTSVSASPVQMMVTAIDTEIDVLRRDFEGRHPGLGELADLAFVAGDIRTDDPALIDALRKRAGRGEPCAVYVAVGEADLPLSVAIALRDRAERMSLFRAPIFICAHHGAGLPVVRQGAGLVGQRADASSVKVP